MNATERARRSDSLYYDTSVTNRRALCDKIASLESDLEDAKDTITVLRLNAVLRENENEALVALVLDMLNAWDDVQRETVTGPSFDECERRAYELGIEANK